MKEFVTPEPDVHSFNVISNLALIYLRQGQPDRALALGVAAMAFGPVTPELALITADAFLRTGQHEQADAILSRFWAPDLLKSSPSPEQLCAANILLAKALQKGGDTQGARKALAQANSLAGTSL